jgi:SecD/SecF fusion protein
LGAAFAAAVGVVMLTSGSCRPSPRPVSIVLIYEVDRPEEGPDRKVDIDKLDIDELDMDKLAAVIDGRINRASSQVARVRRLGDRRIEIGVFRNHPQEVRRIERIVERTGTLEFRILANNRDHKPLIERAGREDTQVLTDPKGNVQAWWVPVHGEETLEHQEYLGVVPDYWDIAERTRKTGQTEVTEVLVVKDPYDVTGAYLQNAVAERDMFGQPCVGFVLNPAGAQRLGALTGENLPDPLQDFTRRLGIIVDGQLYSALPIQDAVFKRGQVTGSFTRKEVQELVDVLNAGSLPVRIKQVDKRVIDGDQ